MIIRNTADANGLVADSANGATMVDKVHYRQSARYCIQISSTLMFYRIHVGL